MTPRRFFAPPSTFLARLLAGAIALGHLSFLSSLFLLVGLPLLAAPQAQAAQNGGGGVGLLEPPPASVATFQPWELTLGALAPGAKPYKDGPAVDATFVGPDGNTFVVRGFWDGDNVWRVRFAPTLSGTWSYATASTDPGLRHQGTFEATPPDPAEAAANPLLRGFLERPRDSSGRPFGYTWFLSDGTPFFPVGDTQFSFAEELYPEEFEAWMDVLHERKVNTLLGSAWLGYYKRGELSHPFSDENGNGLPDPAGGNLNVGYFQRLDRLVRYANRNGVLVGLVIGGFPERSKAHNPRWWDMFGAEDDDRWFAYVVSRYAAFNVRWVLYGEADERNPSWVRDKQTGQPRKPKKGEKPSWRDEVLYKAALVKAVDPYDHPVGSHQSVDVVVDDRVAKSSLIDYLEVQIEKPGKRTENQYAAARDFRKYRKPLWFEEYWYDIQGTGDDSAQGIRNTHRNFLAALAFPTFGSKMRAHASDPDFPPSQVGGDKNEPADKTSLTEYLQRDKSLRRMEQFARFYSGLDLSRFGRYDTGSQAKFLPDQSGKKAVAARFGNDFAAFLPGNGRDKGVVKLKVGRDRSWSVRVLDVVAGDVREVTLRSAKDGWLTVETQSKNDVAVVVKRPD